MEENKDQKETIHEAQIIETGESEFFGEESVLSQPKKKRKLSDFYIELALFFILGVLIGIAVKTEASKRVTIGFEDYKMNIYPQAYNINKLQADLLQKQVEATKSQTEEGAKAPTENGAGNDQAANQPDTQNQQ